MAPFATIDPTSVTVSKVKELRFDTMLCLAGADGKRLLVETPYLPLDWKPEVKSFRGTLGCQLGIMLKEDDADAQNFKG